MSKLGWPGDSPLYAVPGNPDKSMLGGDNSSGETPVHLPCNPDPGGVIPSSAGDPGDTKYGVRGNPSPEELKRMFRDGSDALPIPGP